MRIKDKGRRCCTSVLRAMIASGVLGCALLWAAAPAAVAAEEVTHLFNATHSLTGDCSVSGPDPVPDPGCPGGAHPPSGPFDKPNSVATGQYGETYVLSGETDHVDIFSASGHFLT